jgi:hypothetical protein
LVAEVFLIDNSVGVVILLPYLAGEILAHREGEPAFDQLGAAFDCNVWCWGKQDVDVVGHHDEGVELEFSGVSIAEERGNEEFSDGVALEDAASLVGDGSEDVVWDLRRIVGGRVPRAEAPCFSVAGIARTEVRAYLRSKSNDGESVLPGCGCEGWS